MKMKKVREMVANDYGIMIKKCCGSCHNRGFDEPGATLLSADRLNMSEVMRCVTTGR